MKINLFHRENPFFQLLEALATKAEETVKLFRALIDSWDSAHPNIQAIIDIEHDCDKIVHEIMVKLNKTFITPIDREDIHLLAKNIDDLVDSIHSLSNRLVLFKIKTITPDLNEMTLVFEKAVSLIVIAVHRIKKIKNPQEIIDYCIQINTYENQADRIFEKAISQLFNENANPLEVIKWKEIYEALELATDKCEDIADILWGIVVKYG